MSDDQEAPAEESSPAEPRTMNPTSALEVLLGAVEIAKSEGAFSKLSFDQLGELAGAVHFLRAQLPRR